jgi:hypothetical protein
LCFTFHAAKHDDEVTEEVWKKGVPLQCPTKHGHNNSGLRRIMLTNVRAFQCTTVDHNRMVSFFSLAQDLKLNREPRAQDFADFVSDLGAFIKACNLPFSCRSQADLALPQMHVKMLMHIQSGTRMRTMVMNGCHRANLAHFSLESRCQQDTQMPWEIQSS